MTLSNVSSSSCPRSRISVNCRQVMLRRAAGFAVAPDLGVSRRDDPVVMARATAATINQSPWPMIVTPAIAMSIQKKSSKADSGRSHPALSSPPW